MSGVAQLSSHIQKEWRKSANEDTTVTNKKLLQGSIMKLFILILLILLAGCASVEKAPSKSELSLALEYFDELQGKSVEIKGLNTAEHQNFVSILENYIKANDLQTIKNERIFKYYVFNAFILNRARQFNDIEYDVNQTRYATSLVDSLMRLDPNRKYNTDILFSASQIEHFIHENEASTYKYLSACAKRGGGQCTNTLAHGYSDGTWGATEDMQSAVFWHQKTVDTGTRNRCAGVYSSINIKWISQLYPEVDTGHDWTYWKEVTESLYDRVITQDKNNIVWCNLVDTYLDEYMFQTYLGNNAKEYHKKYLSELEELMKYKDLSDDQLKHHDAMKFVFDEISFAEVQKILPTIEDQWTFCHSIGNLYVNATIEQDETTKTLLRNIFSSKPTESCTKYANELDRIDKSFVNKATEPKKNSIEHAYDEAQKIFSHMRNQEFHQIIERLPPHVLEKMAREQGYSVEDFLQKIRAAAPGKSNENLSNTLYLTSTLPRQMITVGNELFTIIRYKATIKSVHSRDLIERGFLLAWKTASSPNWYFMSGKALGTQEAITTYFANYNGDLTIPEYRKCIDKC